ncbi:hypothetical protein Tco_0567406 [Tanacetum coccineum]
MKHMASNFDKVDKFEGVDFRRWQKKMYFLLSATPPNGVSFDLLSGGVTSLNISSTKHKERPLRVSDQRPPNQFRHDIYPERVDGITTSHFDLSLLEYELFHFDLSIDLLPPVDKSDCHLEEYADELAHIIFPPEYDHFYFDLEDISSLDPRESTSVIGESTLLVTPLPDSKEISLREVERFDPFFSLTQSGEKTRVMETPSFGFHHMPSPRPAAYSSKVVMYRSFHPHLTSGDGFDHGPKMK